MVRQTAFAPTFLPTLFLTNPVGELDVDQPPILAKFPSPQLTSGNVAINPLPPTARVDRRLDGGPGGPVRGLGVSLLLCLSTRPSDLQWSTRLEKTATADARLHRRIPFTEKPKWNASVKGWIGKVGGWEQSPLDALQRMPKRKSLSDARHFRASAGHSFGQLAGHRHAAVADRALLDRVPSRFSAGSASRMSWPSKRSSKCTTWNIHSGHCLSAW